MFYFNALSAIVSASEITAPAWHSDGDDATVASGDNMKDVVEELEGKFNDQHIITDCGSGAGWFEADVAYSDPPALSDPLLPSDPFAPTPASEDASFSFVPPSVAIEAAARYEVVTEKHPPTKQLSQQFGKFQEAMDGPKVAQELDNKLQQRSRAPPKDRT